MTYEKIHETDTTATYIYTGYGHADKVKFKKYPVVNGKFAGEYRTSADIGDDYVQYNRAGGRGPSMVWINTKEL